MSRIPKSYLVARFTRLAKEMKWKTGPRWIAPPVSLGGDGSNKCVVGHVALEHNSVYGWNINQTMNDAGGERRLLESCSARELDAWISGALFVLQAQEDAKRARKEKRNKLRAYVTAEDAKLYGPQAGRIQRDRKEEDKP